MCVVCGCGNSHDHRHDHAHEHEHGRAHAHTHDHAAGAGPHVDAATGDLHYGSGEARVSVPGLSPARAIKLEADVLGENGRLAALNRAHFAAHGVQAFNLVSSPGSGKTTLLVATIAALRRRRPALHVAVIEGDQQTSNDAERIRATGAPAIQVNTGKGCHLDAQMVGDAFARLHSHGHHGHGHDHHPRDAGDGGDASLLFIENVGNLVCPALWDLGERAKLAILSVTEGEDKPLKYPDMFAAASLMVLNKVDLLPHVDFDVERCIDYARRVNPGIEVLLVSARSGTGMDAWLDWLLDTLPVPAAAAAAHA
jgi:hydrogenase nickel incorporation protein HypB